MSSSGSSSSSKGGTALSDEKAKAIFPNAENVGFKGAKIGSVIRPDGSREPGLIITGKDGTTIGFTLGVAQSKFTGTSRTVSAVTSDGKKKIVLSPKQMKEIERMLGKRQKK